MQGRDLGRDLRHADAASAAARGCPPSLRKKKTRSAGSSQAKDDASEGEPAEKKPKKKLPFTLAEKALRIKSRHLGSSGYDEGER